MIIKMAIVGAGYIGKIHADAIAKHPNAKLVAIVDSDVDKARLFSTKYSTLQIFENLNELIASNQADAVVIGTPNYLHEPMAIKALESGMHVLVEKPMAISVSEAINMQVVSDQTNKTLMIAHCWRYDPEVIWLRDQISKNKIGNIVRTKAYGNHINWGPEGWFTQKSLSGGGALMDMGIHAIDTTRYLLGDPEPSSIFAKISTSFCNFEVDDTGIMIITWNNGVISYIEFGWWQPHSDGLEGATQLYGTRGFGSVFPTKLITKKNQDGKDEFECESFSIPRNRHNEQIIYDEQMSHFIECINQKTTPISNAYSGVINTKILMAAYKSSKSGKTVHF